MKSLEVKNKIIIYSPSESGTIQFFSSGELIGTLYFENPMRFEGKAEKSAEVFFKYLIELFDKRESIS